MDTSVYYSITKVVSSFVWKMPCCSCTDMNSLLLLTTPTCVVCRMSDEANLPPHPRPYSISTSWYTKPHFTKVNDWWLVHLLIVWVTYHEYTCCDSHVAITDMPKLKCVKLHRSCHDSLSWAAAAKLRSLRSGLAGGGVVSLGRTPWHAIQLRTMAISQHFTCSKLLFSHVLLLYFNSKYI